MTQTVTDKNFSFNNFSFARTELETESPEIKTTIAATPPLAAFIPSLTLNRPAPATANNLTANNTTQQPTPMHNVAKLLNSAPAPITKVDPNNTTAGAAMKPMQTAATMNTIVEGAKREMAAAQLNKPAAGAEPQKTQAPVATAPSTPTSFMGKGTDAIIAGAPATSTLLTPSFSRGSRNSANAKAEASAYKSAAPDPVQSIAPTTPAQMQLNRMASGPGFGRGFDTTSVSSFLRDDATKGVKMDPTVLAKLNKTVIQVGKDATLAHGLAKNGIDNDQALTAGIMKIGAPRPESTAKPTTLRMPGVPA